MVDFVPTLGTILWDSTRADFPLCGMQGTEELFSEDFLPVTLYVTVPRSWWIRQLELFFNGGQLHFSTLQYPLGAGHPFNFQFSPRSATLWFTFMVSIGLQQGTLAEHLTLELLIAPVTLGIRVMKSTFDSSAHSWNRYYTDFFTKPWVVARRARPRQDLLWRRLQLRKLNGCSCACCTEVDSGGFQPQGLGSGEKCIVEISMTSFTTRTMILGSEVLPGLRRWGNRGSNLERTIPCAGAPWTVRTGLAKIRISKR